jgi:hypothetical protein
MADTVLSTPLGDFDIDKVYMEYDGPRVFSCRDRSRSLFLCLWVEESFDYDRWLFVPVSQRRLDATVTGILSLRDAVEQAENGWVWLVKTADDVASSTYEMISASAVPQRFLPPSDLRLAIRNARALVEPVDPVTEAVQGRRNVIYMFLDPLGLRPSEIQASLLGRMLVSTQNLVSLLSSSDHSTRGRLPLDLEEATTLLYTGQVCGSFGARLEAQDAGDLFGNALISEGLNNIVRLLNSSTDTNALRSSLFDIGPRAAVQYRQLLKTAFDSGSGLRMQWGTPTRGSGSAMLTREQISAALELFGRAEPELKNTLKVSGRLVGVNVFRKKFEFVTDDGIHFTGTYDSDFEQTWHLTEPPVAAVIEGLAGSAILEETVQVAHATGKETFSYVLLKLEADGYIQQSP